MLRLQPKHLVFLVGNSAYLYEAAYAGYKEKYNTKIMRSKNILFSLIVLFTTLASAQVTSGSIKYKVKYNPDRKEESLKHPDAAVFGERSKRADLKVVKSIPSIEFHLEFNKSESLFTPKTDYLAREGEFEPNLLLSFLVSNGIWYKDLENNQSVYQRNYLDIDWLVEDVITNLDWEITKEIRKINGYTCFKAVAKLDHYLMALKTVEVWFTPEIPFQFGPMNYGGLPGLILEIEHGYYTFYAEEINFSNEDVKIKRPNKGELVSREEYNQKTKEILDKLKENYR